jgi:hypothetical protein
MPFLSVSSNREGIPFTKKQPKKAQTTITAAFTSGPSIKNKVAVFSSGVNVAGTASALRNKLSGRLIDVVRLPLRPEKSRCIVMLRMEFLYVRPVWKILAVFLLKKRFRKAFVDCAITAMRFFFLPQYRALLFPKRIPVSQSDHPLDNRIPFNPRWVKVYLDFVAFWIRIAGFLRVHCGKNEAGLEFIQSIERLYVFAAQLYRKNLSTTRRPRYLKGIRFFLIHITDPHLMCIPSLHVMIVIRGYTAFRQILASMNKTENYAVELELVKKQALNITQAILYVKQHSVNCVSAAMYAMSRFDPDLFPVEEAEIFAGGLFSPRNGLPGGDAVAARDIPEIRSHITGLYRRFIEEGKNAAHWTEPLLGFLASLPRVGERGH